MRLFISGSAGYIGTELVRHFTREDDFDIVKYDLRDGMDILDFKELKKAMEGVDVVIHLAGIRGPYEDKKFAEYFKVNCVGTFNIAEAALENKIRRVIFSSSTSYYGVESGIPYITST